MLKLVGCGAIMIITAMIGGYFSAELDKRRVTLKNVGYLLDEISALIRYKSATVYEILERVSQNERLSALWFIGAARNGSRNKPFCEVWESAVYSRQIPYLHKDDLNLIISIGKNLGISDSEGQLNILSLEKEELRALYESAAEAYKSKAKLYRTLGFLAGAFICILIL